MDFRDFASNETSALIGRLLASNTDASLHQLRTLRDALDEAARHAEAAIATAPAVDEEIQDLVKRLNNAAGAAIRTVSQRLKEEAKTALDGVRTELDAVRGELDEQRAHNERLSIAIAELEAQTEVLTSDVGDERARAEHAEHELSEAREARDQVETARRDLEAACQQLTDARTTAEDELRETRGLLDASLYEAARVAEQLEAERNEKTTLHGELTAARDALEQLEAVRAEVEAACRIESDARASAEDHLRETRNLLDSALAQSARLSDQLDTEAAEATSLRARLAEADEQVEAIKAAAAASSHELRETRASLETELNDVRSALDASLSEAAALGQQLEARAAEHGALLAELSAAQGELHTAQSQRDGIAAQLKASLARVQTLERTQGKHDEVVRQLQERLDAALAGEAALRDREHDGGRELTDAQAELGVVRGDLDRVSALLDASVRGLEDLASAESLVDLLARLVSQLSTEFSRVALFRVKGNRLEGEHQIGFDQTTDVTKLVIPLTVESLLTRAASSGVVEHLTDSDKEDGGVALFGSSPASALALPIVLHAETLAVVYAEQSNQAAASTQSASTAFATVLVRHTVALLTRLTNELKALAELRGYASTLLQEAEQMYSADRDSGKNGEELRNRLKDNVECARQLFASRAALEGAAAGSLLDEQITMLFETQAETPFSRDLAKVVGHAPRSKRRTAEAS